MVCLMEVRMVPWDGFTLAKYDFPILIDPWLRPSCFLYRWLLGGQRTDIRCNVTLEMDE